MEDPVPIKKLELEASFGSKGYFFLKNLNFRITFSKIQGQLLAMYTCKHTDLHSQVLHNVVSIKFMKNLQCRLPEPF